MHLSAHSLSGGVGVEVTGLDPTGEIPEQVAQELREIWLDAGVVLFRGLGTSPAALLNVSRCLGELEPHPIELFRLQGFPELILLSNENALTGPVYEFDGVPTYGRIPWHTDLAFTTKPNAGAVLRMVKNSEHGGQTGWIDTAKAWEDLDRATQERIEGLEARYIFARDLDGMRFNRPNGRRLSESSSDIPDYPSVANPLVWTHPETGRRILNISTLNIQSILGLPEDESDALIEDLIEHTLQPKYQYIHEWVNDDIVAWDNWRTLHMAAGHPVDEVRIAQRSTIRGSIEMGRVIDGDTAGGSRMSVFDLVIRGGNLVDGSGSPAREADIAVKNGVIAAVSEKPGTEIGKGQEEIDARGLLVTPGFVDLHTHYDGHVTWENRLRPSSSHGVTTAIIGNCGVGFAPCKPEHRDTLIRLMDGVEDIPFPVLAEGLPWTWESYPDYLDVLASRQFDMDVGGYVPHAALRVFVMGERGAQREPATDDDIQLMCFLLEEALDAGAMGIATSRTLFHRSSDGQPIPTFDASDDELIALARILRKKGRGVFQIVEDVHLPGKGLASMRRIAEASGRPLTFSMGTTNVGPYLWPQLLDDLARANADGIVIKGQVLPRAIGMLLGLELTLNPFYSTTGYKELASLPLEGRLERMRNPAVRARIIAEPLDPDPALVLGRMVRDFDHMFVLGDPPDYEQPREQSIAGRAKTQGISPEEMAYDLMLAGDRGSMLYVAVSNYADGNLDAVGSILRHPDVLPGLGDGGAHAATICDGSYSTFLLSHWGRDRKAGRIPVADIIHWMCRATALTVGLEDRGLVAEGYKADLNIIDFDRLSLHAPRIHNDLPRGGTRLLQAAEGYVATIVAGVPVYREGKETGALPGRLVRGPQRPQA